MNIKTLKDLLEFIMSHRTPSSMEVDLGVQAKICLYGSDPALCQGYNHDIYAMEDDYFILRQTQVPHRSYIDEKTEALILREFMIIPIARILRINVDKNLIGIQ